MPRNLPSALQHRGRLRVPFTQLRSRVSNRVLAPNLLQVNAFQTLSELAPAVCAASMRPDEGKFGSGWADVFRGYPSAQTDSWAAIALSAGLITHDR